MAKIKKNIIYYLHSCSTCQGLIKSWKTDTCQLVDIKSVPITEAIIDDLAKKAGSYEALFSRKAIKYRTMNLKEKKMSEMDFRSLILSDYTFLKRPVVVIGSKILIGNTKDQTEQVQALLQN